MMAVGLGLAVLAALFAVWFHAVIWTTNRDGWLPGALAPRIVGRRVLLLPPVGRPCVAMWDGARWRICSGIYFTGETQMRGWLPIPGDPERGGG